MCLLGEFQDVAKGEAERKGSEEIAPWPRKQWWHTPPSRGA